MKTITIFSLLLLTIFSCSKETPSDSPRIVFKYAYSKYAWGTQTEGFTVDTEGQIRSGFHSFQKNEEGLIDAETIEDSHILNNPIVDHVGQRKLKSKINKIPKANKGILDTIGLVWDAGNQTYTAYIYIPEKNAYEEILLKASGTYKIKNKSTAAGSIAKWMKNIQKDLF